jgi:hypothetical protein
MSAPGMISSVRVLMEAVRDELRKSLGYKDNECQLSPPTGQPPAEFGGKVYVAVCEGQTENTDDVKMSLDELVALTVVITMRAQGVPYDRHANELLYKPETGLADRVHAIKIAVHRDSADDRIRKQANKSFPAATTNGFIETLRYMSADTPQPVGADWFWGEPGDKIAAYVQTVRFGKARRKQRLESIQ